MAAGGGGGTLLLLLHLDQVDAIGQQVNFQRFLLGPGVGVSGLEDGGGSVGDGVATSLSLHLGAILRGFYLCGANEASQFWK